MGFERVKSKIKVLFVQEIFKTQGIDDQTQKRVASATGCIPEGLDRHQFPERRVKKVDYGE